MSEIKIRRKNRSPSVTTTTSTTTSTTLRIDDMAGGVVQIGTITTNAATFQVWGSSVDTGTFARLYDSAGAVADITLAPSTSTPSCYALPDAAFGLPFIKLVSGTTNANTTATVMLKS
jgi:hypothetical protein